MAGAGYEAPVELIVWAIPGRNIMAIMWTIPLPAWEAEEWRIMAIMWAIGGLIVWSRVAIETIVWVSMETSSRCWREWLLAMDVVECSPMPLRRRAIPASARRGRRLMARGEAATGKDLRAEMHAALVRSRETGRTDGFLVARPRYNAEVARLRKELHELTGEWYEPRDA